MPNILNNALQIWNFKKRCIFAFLMLFFLLDNVMAPEIQEEDIYHYRPSFGLTSNGKPILKELSIIPTSNINIKLMDKSEIDDDEEEPNPEKVGTVVWQLFNHCGKGFLQIDSTVNARGTTSSLCNINFIVRIEGAGSVVLRHALTKKYVCFNRRKRITMKKDKNDIKCHFIERVNSAGYTMLESTWWPRLYLGFNHKGRFQDPSQFRRKYRCFLFTKLERFASAKELRRCTTKKQARNEIVRRNRDEQGAVAAAASSSITGMIHHESNDKFQLERSLFQHARKSLLSQVEV